MKSRIPLTVLLQLVVFFSLCAGARHTGAAAQNTAKAITSQVIGAYTVPVDAEEISGAVAFALNAGVPPEHVRALAEGAARAKRAPSELARYLNETADFRLNNLPTAAAVSTILEGIAKGAPPESIDLALGTAKRNLAFCTSLAERHRVGKRGKARPSEILVTALSLALNAGFTESDLEQLSGANMRAGNAPDYIIACLESMLELRGTPLSQDQIARLITLAVEKKFSARDLSQLPGLVTQKLRESRLKGPGREGPSRESFSRDAVYASIIEEIEKSTRPSEFFAALGYRAQPGQGKTGAESAVGSGAVSGSVPGGTSGGTPGGAGGGGGGSSGGGAPGGSPGGKK